MIEKLERITEFTDEFNDYIRLVNIAVGAQVFITLMQIVISLIILIFTLAYTFAVNSMEMRDSLIFFMFGVAFVHFNLFQMCYISDMVERKVNTKHNNNFSTSF